MLWIRIAGLSVLIGSVALLSVAQACDVRVSPCKGSAAVSATNNSVGLSPGSAPIAAGMLRRSAGPRVHLPVRTGRRPGLLRHLAEKRPTTVNARQANEPGARPPGYGLEHQPTSATAALSTPERIADRTREAESAGSADSSPGNVGLERLATPLSGSDFLAHWQRAVEELSRIDIWRGEILQTIYQFPPADNPGVKFRD